jgi:iron complex transport system substrate-binding protein
MTRLLVLVLLLLLVQATAVRAEIALADDRGRGLVLREPAQRIVSLAPNLTELLFAAGAGARLVGTVAYSDFPAPARRVARVGDSTAIDVERVVALKPDVVLAWRSGNPPGTIAKLEQLGVRVFVTEPGTLGAIADEIVLFGRIAGTDDSAAKAAIQFRREVAALRHDYQGRRPVSVFYQVWYEPLMTVNGKQVISAVIDLCGGRNIFAGLPALVPRVSLEAVLAANPEAIVTASDQPAAQALADWSAWQQLRAVRDGNLVVIPPDDISRPTPRLLNGARRLCAQLDRIRRADEQRP